MLRFDGPSAFFEAGAPVIPAGPALVSPVRGGPEPGRPEQPENQPSTEDSTLSTYARAPPTWPSQEKAQMGFRFPAVRSVLWDATSQGPKVFVGTEDALPDIKVPGSALAALLPGIQDSCGALGVMVVADTSEEQENSDQLVVCRYEPDATARLVGHFGLRVADGRADHGSRRPEIESAVLTSLRGRGPTSVGALLRPEFVANVTAEPELRLQISVEVVAPAATLVATPIRSLRCDLPLPSPFRSG